MRLAASCVIMCIILLGYISWIYTDLKVNMFLAPCITVTGITAVVYMAGLLNVMTAAFTPSRYWGWFFSSDTFSESGGTGS